MRLFERMSLEEGKAIEYLFMYKKFIKVRLYL